MRGAAKPSREAARGLNVRASHEGRSRQGRDGRVEAEPAGTGGQGAGRRGGLGDRRRWGREERAAPGPASPVSGDTGSRDSPSLRGGGTKSRSSVKSHSANSLCTAGGPGQITRCTCCVSARLASSRTTPRPAASMKLNRLRSSTRHSGLRHCPGDRILQRGPCGEITLTGKLDTGRGPAIADQNPELSRVIDRFDVGGQSDRSPRRGLLGVVEAAPGPETK